MKSKTKPITINLLGDIAAGKGTQAKIFAKRHNFKIVDVGAYSRKMLTGRSKISRRLARVALGKLGPSDIIQNYLRKELKTVGSGNLLIDGGKMPAEARLIYRLLTQQDRQPIVIYLTLPKKEIFKRLAYRYYCERTGRPVILKHPGRCPHCGGRVIKRADDEPGAIKNRIAYYHKVYSQTVKFWQKKKLLWKIRGNQTIAQVTADIEKVIKKSR